MLLAVWIAGFTHADEPLSGTDYGALYADRCAVCHGDKLQGAAQGPSLGGKLSRGESVDDVISSISIGAPDSGMPRWSETLSAQQIKNIALYVLETRRGFNYRSMNQHVDFTVPTGTIRSEVHDFRLEIVAAGLDPLPFSIAPLPDGRILLVEKKRGLSIVSSDGTQSPLVAGTPPAYGDTVPIVSGAAKPDREDDALSVEVGHGWMLDVALHPDYVNNGWVYIHSRDRCSDCNALSRATGGPVSQSKLVRGRIRDGKWIDQEVIWQSDIEFYGPYPDLGAGGRIAFDRAGHVFMSIGLGIDHYQGIQDLRTPWGKVHRVFDDGRIPPDNPFVGTKGVMPTIWTYGHRSPQGLEFRAETGEVWETEMGPRGGDELNRLQPGRNYGWPLHSRGVNYDGTPVDYGRELGIAFSPDDIEQPVVDLTPSPGVSSFVFYGADRFPGWKNNILVGNLKARSLVRMVLDGNEVVQQETLLDELARVRDIEVGPRGEVYVLLENYAGATIVRMVPATVARTGSSRGSP